MCIRDRFTGDGSGITGLTADTPSGTVSSSAQLASAISGSFNKGFGFSGEISGSRTSTGSFGRLNINDNVQGNLDAVTVDHTNIVSSSGQISSQISGAFTSGFVTKGKISGSADSTGSLSSIEANIFETKKMNVVRGYPISASSTISCLLYTSDAADE